MDNRPIQSKKRYFQAFVIGTLIFVAGFILTNSIAYFQFQRISEFQDEISYSIFQDKLLYEFFGEDLCSNEFLTRISEDLGFQGAIIYDLEKKLGKQNKQVLFRKRFYTLIELEHFEYVTKLKEDCGFNISTIFFFYSNEEGDIEMSENTGRMLDSVYNRNGNIIIYSFDVNLESDMIERLKEKYSIETTPTLIINGNKKIVEPSNINDIEKYLNVEGGVILL